MRNWILALLLAATFLVVAPPPAFAPTAVEYAFGAGPVGLGLNQTARIGLLLPAVQRATVRLIVLNRGDVLFRRDVPIEVTKSGFFDVFFDVAVDDRGDVHITDGAVDTVVGSFGDQGGQVSILIGLLLPAVQKLPESANHMSASLQLLPGDGSVRLALPFIEHRLTR
jgi:hypothetical protein